MKYFITRSRRWPQSFQCLETAEFSTRAQAMSWFTDYVWDILIDTDGYRHESYLGSGPYIHEPSDTTVDALPDWWVGEGIYNDSDQMVLKLSYPRDGSETDIDSLEIGDWTYRLEAVQYLRTSDVCRMLGVSKPTVFAMIRRGDLPAVRIGNRWAFDPDEVEKMLP